MTDPYRDPAAIAPDPRMFPDATDAEIAFWDSIASAVANASNCNKSATAANWADTLLVARRKRFGRQ